MTDEKEDEYDGNLIIKLEEDYGDFSDTDTVILESENECSNSSNCDSESKDVFSVLEQLDASLRFENKSGVEQDKENRSKKRKLYAHAKASERDKKRAKKAEKTTTLEKKLAARILMVNLGDRVKVPHNNHPKKPKKSPRKEPQVQTISAPVTLYYPPEVPTVSEYLKTAADLPRAIITNQIISPKAARSTSKTKEPHKTDRSMPSMEITDDNATIAAFPETYSQFSSGNFSITTSAPKKKNAASIVTIEVAHHPLPSNNSAAAFSNEKSVTFGTIVASTDNYSQIKSDIAACQSNEINAAAGSPVAYEITRLPLSTKNSADASSYGRAGKSISQSNKVIAAAPPGVDPTPVTPSCVPPVSFISVSQIIESGIKTAFSNGQYPAQPSTNDLATAASSLRKIRRPLSSCQSSNPDFSIASSSVRKGETENEMINASSLMKVNAVALPAPPKFARRSSSTGNYTVPPSFCVSTSSNIISQAPGSCSTDNNCDRRYSALPSSVNSGIAASPLRNTIVADCPAIAATPGINQIPDRSLSSRDSSFVPSCISASNLISCTPGSCSMRPTIDESTGNYCDGNYSALPLSVNSKPVATILWKPTATPSEMPPQNYSVLASNVDAGKLNQNIEKRIEALAARFNSSATSFEVSHNDSLNNSHFAQCLQSPPATSFFPYNKDEMSSDRQPADPPEYNTHMRKKRKTSSDYASPMVSDNSSQCRYSQTPKTNVHHESFKRPLTVGLIENADFARPQAPGVGRRTNNHLRTEVVRPTISKTTPSAGNRREVTYAQCVSECTSLIMHSILQRNYTQAVVNLYSQWNCKYLQEEFRFLSARSEQLSQRAQTYFSGIFIRDFDVVVLGHHFVACLKNEHSWSWTVVIFLIYLRMILKNGHGFCQVIYDCVSKYLDARSRGVFSLHQSILLERQIKDYHSLVNKTNRMLNKAKLGRPKESIFLPFQASPPYVDREALSSPNSNNQAFFANSCQAKQPPVDLYNNLNSKFLPSQKESTITKPRANATQNSQKYTQAPIQQQNEDSMLYSKLVETAATVTRQHDHNSLVNRISSNTTNLLKSSTEQQILGSESIIPQDNRQNFPGCEGSVSRIPSALSSQSFSAQTDAAINHVQFKIKEKQPSQKESSIAKTCANATQKPPEYTQAPIRQQNEDSNLHPKLIEPAATPTVTPQHVPTLDHSSPVNRICINTTNLLKSSTEGQMQSDEIASTVQILGSESIIPQDNRQNIPGCEGPVSRIPSALSSQSSFTQTDAAINHAQFKIKEEPVATNLVTSHCNAIVKIESVKEETANVEPSKMDESSIRNRLVECIKFNRNKNDETTDWVETATQTDPVHLSNDQKVTKFEPMAYIDLIEDESARRTDAAYTLNSFQDDEIVPKMKPDTCFDFIKDEIVMNEDEIIVKSEPLACIDLIEGEKDSQPGFLESSKDLQESDGITEIKSMAYIDIINEDDFGTTTTIKVDGCKNEAEQQKFRTFHKSYIDLEPMAYIDLINDDDFGTTTSMERATTAEAGQQKLPPFDKSYIDLVESEEDDSPDFPEAGTASYQKVPKVENANVEEAGQSTSMDSGQYLHLSRVCICGKFADMLCHCKTVCYCSHECQYIHWDEHKNTCSYLSENNAE